MLRKLQSLDVSVDVCQHKTKVLWQNCILFNYRSRLETNAEQWNNLLKTLKDLIDWTVQKDEEIQRQQPVGGDLNSVKKQAEEHQVNGNLNSADVTRCQTTAIIMLDFCVQNFLVVVSPIPVRFGQVSHRL